MHWLSLIMLMAGVSQVLIAILDYQLVRKFQPSDPLHRLKLTHIKFGKLQAKVGVTLMAGAAVVQVLALISAQ